MNIRKHKNLEPKLWDENDMLRKPVRDMLIKIVSSYIASVRGLQRVNIDDSDIKDVFIYGSCTNYFYTETSDIDMCIVLDIDSIIAKNPGLNAMHSFKLYYYNWMMAHRCKIYGRDIDVSIEDVKNTNECKRYRSGPEFSVAKNDWIFKPIIISDSEFKQISKDANRAYRQIMDDFQRVKKNGFKFDETQKLYSDIYGAKNMAHKMNQDQPITYMYIAFRKVRSRGVIDTLRDKMVDSESENFILK